MFSKISSLCLQGIEGTVISVEADVSDGLPGYIFVGYLASEVREAQDRVRTAIRNLGLGLPPKKVTINLSPADFRKEGTGFDLAIAVAILMSYGVVSEQVAEQAVFVGELGLDGTVKGIPGILAIADLAKKQGFKRIYLPNVNLREASVISEIGLVGISSLKETLDLLTGKRPFKESISESAGFFSFEGLNQYRTDFSEVNGQPLLRRAAEVAAAGKHNLLIIGPAGSGKTMVARRMPTIMPELTLKESIEISKLYSVCHLLSDREPLILSRPFRAPHHSISMQALAGGGSRPRPGEISLASGGILFLDELPEMKRSTLEALRQPLEERCITVARVQGAFRYPADFQLVAAMNPCLCGCYPDRERCTCTPSEIRRYLGRVSRPLLDRMDICVEAASVTYEDVQKGGNNEDSASIRRRVELARQIQKKRFGDGPVRCNGEMSGKQVKQFCSLPETESLYLKSVFQKMQFSARSYDKILKVARTAADLEGCENICRRHISEAVSYARLKEKYWGR